MEFYRTVTHISITPGQRKGPFLLSISVRESDKVCGAQRERVVDAMRGGRQRRAQRQAASAIAHARQGKQLKTST